MQWIGPDGTILWANRTVLELLGYQHDQFVGRNFAAFLDGAALGEDLLRRFRAGEAVPGYEIRIRCGDGTPRWMRIDASPWTRNGELLHTRCFV
ncbi:MAG: PAS domain-containing protein, partial [Acidobacteriaceae bacterium]